MQRLLSFAIVLMAFTMNVNAQVDTLRYFVDYFNKKCPPKFATFYRMEVKEGELWYVEDYYINENVLQMKGRFLDDSATKPQGTVYLFHKNGKLQSIESYKDGLEDGLSLNYDSTGKMLDSVYYKNGQPSGYHFTWNEGGKLTGFGVYDDKGKGTGETWHYHDNGNLCCHGKKSEGNATDGLWAFYYRDGGISSRETYDKGRFKKRSCYDPGDSTRGVRCKKSPSNRSLTRELQKKYRPSDPIIQQCKKELHGGFFLANVCVEIDGKIDVDILQSFYPCFDDFVKGALEGLQVEPQIRHNRPQRVCDEIKIDLDEYGLLLAY